MTVRFGLASLAVASLLVLHTALAVAQVAQAPDDTGSDGASASARARYNAGSKAFAEKRFVEAALDFEAAAAEKPSPVALFTAALSWEQANVPERAADDYARALAVAGLPADKVGAAKDRLAALEGVLGVIVVVGPEGTRVQLDANSELPCPATLHASAGVHTLSTRNAGQSIERRPVVLERGKAAKLDLATEPPPPPSTAVAKNTAPSPAPPPPPPPPVETGTWRHPAGFTAIGVGAALLLSGIVLGSETVGARDAYRGAPTQATYDHASELEMWTNVAFIAGGVMAAGGIALVLWPTSHASADPAAKPEGIRLSLAPGGFLMRGAF